MYISENTSPPRKNISICNFEEKQRKKERGKKKNVKKTMKENIYEKTKKEKR
jgi:hypothetical protein